MRRNRENSIRKAVSRMFLLVVMTVMMTFLCACSGKESTGSGTAADNGEAEPAETESSETAGGEAENGEETSEEAPDSGEEQEGGVRAADPMTQEEIEADDSEGCIEDSEDLLY